MTNRDVAVVRENIALLNQRTGRELEKRLPLIRELGRVLSELFSERTEEDLPALLLRVGGALREREMYPDCLALHERPVLTLLKSLSAEDGILLATAFCEGCAARGQPITYADFFPQDSIGHRIAFVRNAYTDEAYEIFASEDPQATLLYADSFRDACEAVGDGRADLCILPFENSAGPLPTFSEMAARHSLVLTAFCRVFHADGTDATRFALLSPLCLAERVGEEPHLRLSLRVRSAATLGAHLSAFAAVGARLIALSTLPDAADEEALSCTLTLAPDGKEAVIPLLTYLYAFTENPVILGMYKEIKK